MTRRKHVLAEAFTKGELSTILRDKSTGKIVLTLPGERILATCVCLLAEIGELEDRISTLESCIRLRKGGY